MKGSKPPERWYKLNLDGASCGNLGKAGGWWFDQGLQWELVQMICEIHQICYQYYNQVLGFKGWFEADFE